jgi:hypothetical protein
MNKSFLAQQFKMAAIMHDMIMSYEAAGIKAALSEKNYLEYSFEDDAGFQNQLIDIKLNADKTPLFNYCKAKKHLDSPLGDLCSDIMRDPEMTEATNIYHCLAKLVGFLEVNHLKSPAQTILNAMYKEQDKFFNWVYIQSSL